MSKPFYITTTLPYVNASPHIGFALEIVQADAIARYRRMQGDEVFFNTGTDEHGLKIHRKAEEEGKNTQSYVDEYAKQFDNLKESLNLSYNAFIRTTDTKHIAAAQAFWKKCNESGDIYKKMYSVKYCVGCELEKTESELEDGKCAIHPNLEIETIEEENYFFKFSNYQEKLLKLYKDNPEFVLPEWRLKEVSNFVESGLEDFSVSRLKEKMPWGVPVPDDEDHVMYVWFDALVNYISTIGWPASARATEGHAQDSSEFEKWWPVVQVAGKDNLRQQSAMWQAMLMSAGMEPSKQILIHGFITADGQKMSKSLGNVIDPFEMVEKYGTDALRYYLLAEITPFEDGDFTIEKFEKRFNGDLANGLGNVVSRVSTLLAKDSIEISIEQGNDKALKDAVAKEMENYQLHTALDILWAELRQVDEELAEKKPWSVESVDEKKTILEPVAQKILNVADLLVPFLPKTAESVISLFTQKQISKSKPLFPRV